MNRENELICVRSTHNHMYGYEKKEILRCIGSGKIMLLDTTSPSSLELILGVFRNAKTVLIKPFSDEKLAGLNENEHRQLFAERLSERDGNISKAELDKRVEENIVNIKALESHKYDYTLVKDRSEGLEKKPCRYR